MLVLYTKSLPSDASNNGWKNVFCERKNKNRKLYLVKEKFIVKISSGVASIASCGFLCTCKFVLQLIPVFFEDDTFKLCVFLEQEKSKLATMERRIRDATRLMSTDGTNDSNAQDDVSIGAGFLLFKVPARTRKPGKMIRHFPVGEKSGNFRQMLLVIF